MSDLSGSEMPLCSLSADVTFYRRFIYIWQELLLRLLDIIEVRNCNCDLCLSWTFYSAQFFYHAIVKLKLRSIRFWKSY